MPPTPAEAIGQLTQTVNSHLSAESEARKALETRLNQLRDAIEPYLKQVPRNGQGNRRDSGYKGVFPSEKMAADFGALILASASPDAAVRENAAKRVKDGGYTIRRQDGTFGGTEDFVKAMGISQDSAGGYLTPDEFAVEIIRNVEVYGTARRYLKKVPMGRERQKWPKRTGGFTVYYPDEGVDATPSDIALGQVTLTAKKWAVLTYISKELEEDALSGLGELVALEFALALAAAEDRNAFIGDGTSTYAGITGVLNSANVATVTMGAGETSFNDLTDAHLVQLITAVPTWAKSADPAFYASPEVVGIVMAMRDGMGRPLYNNAAEPYPYRARGYPVREVHPMPGLADDAISTPFIAFGSLMLWGMLGTRRSMQIQRSDEVRFLQDQVAVKAVPRQDIQEADGEAMAVLSTAAA